MVQSGEKQKGDLRKRLRKTLNHVSESAMYSQCCGVSQLKSGHHSTVHYPFVNNKAHTGI